MRSKTIRQQIEDEVFLKGGVSYNPYRAMPTSGYMVGVKNLEVCDDESGAISQKAWDEAVEAWRHDSPVFLGGWRNGGKTYWDLSLHYHKLDEALAVARDHGELAIYDIAAKQSIALTYNNVDIRAIPAEERFK